MDNLNQIAATIMDGRYHEVTADCFVKAIDADADELIAVIASRNADFVMAWLNTRLDRAIKEAAELADAADALVALEDRPLPTTVRLEDAA